MAQAMQDNYRNVKINEQKQKRVEKYLRDSQKVCEQLDQAQVSNALTHGSFLKAFKGLRDGNNDF